MVLCTMDGAPLQMLLDSGAQVTMVEKAWMEKTLPNTQIQPLESLFPGQHLDITAANGTDVPLEGWADVELQICSHHHGYVAIQVPVLVSRTNLSCPLLGSNVISEILKMNQEEGSETNISALLKEALSINPSAVDALISALQLLFTDETSLECVVKTGKTGLTIPAGQLCEVKCRVRKMHQSRTVLFQPSSVSPCPDGLDFFPALVDVPSGSSKVVKIPAQNTTKHSIYLTKNTVLGSMEEVAEVRAMNWSSVNSEPEPQSTVTAGSAQINNKHDTPDTTTQKWHPPVDISHLEEDEQRIVEDMLYEESDVFAKNDSDIGCITNLKLKINLKDETPVQTAYNSIPKPLYKEVKEYVQNLLDH